MLLLEQSLLLEHAVLLRTLRGSFSLSFFVDDRKRNPNERSKKGVIDKFGVARDSARARLFIILTLTLKMYF